MNYNKSSSSFNPYGRLQPICLRTVKMEGQARKATVWQKMHILPLGRWGDSPKILSRASHLRTAAIRPPRLKNLIIEQSHE